MKALTSAIGTNIFGPTTYSPWHRIYMFIFWRQVVCCECVETCWNCNIRCMKCRIFRTDGNCVRININVLFTKTHREDKMPNCMYSIFRIALKCSLIDINVLFTRRHKRDKWTCIRRLFFSMVSSWLKWSLMFCLWNSDGRFTPHWSTDLLFFCLKMHKQSWPSYSYIGYPNYNITDLFWQ